jgi:hypothetical protein
MTGVGAGWPRSSEFTCSTPCAQAHRQSPAEVPGSLYAGKRPDYDENHMLFIVGVVILLVAVIIPRMRVPGGVNAASLGWMSEQWLGEPRVSHSL